MSDDDLTGIFRTYPPLRDAALPEPAAPTWDSPPRSAADAIRAAIDRMREPAVLEPYVEVISPQEWEWRQANTCDCGDYREQHGGPENRGSCRVCRDGVPPPDGPDGCQRFRARGQL